MIDRLTIILTVREYLNRNDIEGLRKWLDAVEPELRKTIENARARRERTLAREIRPTRREDGIVCFDEKDLYWAFSRQTIRRMGVE